MCLSTGTGRHCEMRRMARETMQHRRGWPSFRFNFRKACRSRLASHPLQVQSIPENSRTCFEGPFGEVIRATGPMAKANPFRFSTKYQDDETDLVYYDFRYLNTSTGRWLSQDPAGERGGLNLYCFNYTTRGLCYYLCLWEQLEIPSEQRGEGRRMLVMRRGDGLEDGGFHCCEVRMILRV